MPKSLREILKGKIPDEGLKKLRAFDIVGEIAVVKIPDELSPWKHEIGASLLKLHKNVRTVLNQNTPVAGEFRTRGLEVIAGDPRTETTYRENGCTFKVDLAKAYFSPRLSWERLRIATLVKPGEAITNMFAGVGCYSIVIAKKSSPSVVYSIDKNPDAFQYMCENIRINKVGDRVVPILGDATEVIENRLAGIADRVLMPLPEFSHDFVSHAIKALKYEGGTLHFYDFGEEPDVFGPSLRFLSSKASKMGFTLKLESARKIRSYATRCYHIALDVSLKKTEGR
ncbi:MAG: class I SAM-dependent methyltransferase family protein [Candidatus Hadarchaeales archaeon]